MTEPRFKVFSAKTETLPNSRQVRVICSTESVDRMGDIIVQSGIDLTAYKKNPVVLWGHNPDSPIARAVDIGLSGGKLQATVEFPEESKDAEADRYYGKIKAGLVNAASVGFVPTEWEAIDPKEPWGGAKFTKSELLEFSFVSIPANKDCLIVGRSMFVGERGPEIIEGKRAFDPRGETEETQVLRKQMARIIAMPTKFRDLANMLPDKAKGARGQLLRCANMLAKEISGESEMEAAAPTPALDEARRRLDALRPKLA